MTENKTERLAGNGRRPVEALPDPEVLAKVKKAKRRQFSGAYKRRILDEVDRCQKLGEIGAVLRREGLYSSLLSTWRRQREGGELDGLARQKRGRRADPQAAEIARLERENERLRVRLEQAETIIGVQKKLSQLLGSNTTASRKDE
jgi:transposase-like protein